MFHGWTRWLCCCCVCLPLWLHGDERELALAVVGPTAPQVQEFAASLKAALPASCRLLPEPQADSVLIALGDEAFRAHLLHPGPLIGVYVSRHQLDAARAAGCRCSGIYRESPGEAQVALLKLLFPQARRIGVLLGEGDAPVDALFSDAYLLKQRRLSAPRPLAAQLSDMLPNIDVLLVMPSLALLDAADARLLLLGSYRQRVPLIGPDAAYVNSGSLASAYPATDALINSTLSLLDDWRSSDRLPAPRYAVPTVAVNPHVARSYGVAADQEQLQSELQARFTETDQ